MHLFLTSSPTGSPYDPGPPVPVFDTSNGFAERLRAVWPAEPPFGLLLSAFPHDGYADDAMLDAFVKCFAAEGVPFSGAAVLDRRNQNDFPALLQKAGFVMLCGGHVPTQNAFFAEIGAAQALRGFDGIVMGVSAGTMNAAEEVYAQPEAEGEAVDPAFQRWLPGLGLTKCNILPHFEVTRGWQLDGLRLVEDVALPDSFHHPLLALPDGSYVYSCGGAEILFGEAWLLKDGRMEKFCENGMSRQL